MAMQSGIHSVKYIHLCGRVPSKYPTLRMYMSMDLKPLKIKYFFLLLDLTVNH
jgi:hypothetical protein